MRCHDRTRKRSPEVSLDKRIFRRAGYATPLTSAAADYLPGDSVAGDLGRGILHFGVVTDRSDAGMPLAMHNIGSGAGEEDILFRFTVIGHYRAARGRHLVTCRVTLTPFRIDSR